MGGEDSKAPIPVAIAGADATTPTLPSQGAELSRAHSWLAADTNWELDDLDPCDVWSAFSESYRRSTLACYPPDDWDEA